MRPLFRASHRRLVGAIIVLCLIASSNGFSQFTDFVKARGDKLFDGDHELRFISVNLPNLHYIEDYLPFEGTNPWRLPDEFEIRDALATVKQMGGKVARIYVFSVKREDDSTGFVRHVQGPGKFNEEAFKTFDRVLQIANEEGIRLIVPFVDNWRWWGGPQEYAAFRGKKRDEFWTDPQLIADMETTISFVINRKNTLTGVPYRDDKAILAWETGNELKPPFSWTKEIAAYVKSLDKNHLLIDGAQARELSQETLTDPNIDIVTTHHYHNPRASLEAIVKNRQLSKDRKPYIIGEYGIVSTEDIRILTETIIKEGLSGGMIWSLRTRTREGGFYSHYEYSNVGAYRWPGFPSGNPYDERVVLALLREKAWAIDGVVPPRIPLPAAPVLLAIKNVGEISWRGTVGAMSYAVERRAMEDTSWSVVGASVDEARYQYRPLFTDETAQIGKKYTYRVRARNDSGVSEYSNTAGPVEVTTKKFVDELEGFDKVFQKDGALVLLVSQDVRRAKEDRSRLTGDDASYIVYKVPVSMDEFTVDAFAADSTRIVRLFTSADGASFHELIPQKVIFSFTSNDYIFFHALSFRLDHVPAGTAYVKIVLDGAIQIGRVEYNYH